MPTPATRPPCVTLADARKSDAAALTRAEVEAILDVDVRTVTRGIESGEIPCLRLGRRRLVPREPFIALMSGDTTIH